MYVPKLNNHDIKVLSCLIVLSCLTLDFAKANAPG